MKKIIGIFMMVGLLALAACASPVAKEIERYVNEDLKPLADMEDEVIAEYDSVIGDNHTDDYETYTHIDEVVLPKYRDFIDKLEAIKLETPEVREVHETYISAANKQFNAFGKILSALEEGDFAIIEEANEMLEEARRGMRDYQAQLESLAKENGVELVDEEEE
ncbi:hypothetical protein ACFFIS_17535 [Virgibacillus soli]|uniref:Lipoprotein n=1 Tax=Paracerasibacillus soli TaxID=480284 RepID=A0ABU5CUK4_9BACI|nr:hypothetical protein [Virgibacillus soli]MDY0409120.1 hypothetical protein [Virgibacillus soli]